MSISIYDLCTKPGHFIGSRHLFLSLALDEKLTSSNASTWLVHTGTSKVFLKSLACILSSLTCCFFASLPPSQSERSRNLPSNKEATSASWMLRRPTVPRRSTWALRQPPALGSSIRWHACSAAISQAGGGVWDGCAGRRQRAPFAWQCPPLTAPTERPLMLQCTVHP